MCGYLFLSLLIVTQASSSTVKVISFFGDNVTLPCWYDTQTYGILSFCWGKGEVPMSKCSNTILSSVDGAVVFRQSHRYHLQGRMKDGDVSLTIRNVQWSDAMVYGCRVEIPGWFNDYKVNIHLIIEEGPLEQTVTKVGTLHSSWIQETLTSAPTTVEVDDPTFNLTAIEEKSKAVLEVGSICKVAAILFFTITVIFIFTFRRGHMPRRMLDNPTTPQDENIYENVPMHDDARYHENKRVCRFQ